MTDVVYRVVEHDGGWAYKLGDVFSETFPTRADAETAATRVAAEQRVPGETEAIEWQDAGGAWHEEIEAGSDRPTVFVEPSFQTTTRPRQQPKPSLAPLLAALAVGACLAILLGARRAQA